MAVSKPTQMTPRAWWHALRDAALEFRDKDLSDNAAALTYYSVLSLFPFLVVLVSLLGVVGSPESIDGMLRIVDELGSGSAVDTVRPVIENIVESSAEAGVALVIGIARRALVGVRLHRRLHPLRERDLRGRRGPAVLEAAPGAAADDPGDDR